MAIYFNSFFGSIILLISLLVFANAEVLEYNFEISFFNGAPDGVKRQILGINGQFPGPTIRAKRGDYLIVNVKNSMNNGDTTTIHWHGIEQKCTPFMDGPENVTQCPIVSEMRYEFPLLQSGTYWYHSHHGSQYVDGCWGALIIENTPEVYEYDEDLLIAVSDWYHYPAKDLTNWYLSRENDKFISPTPDSILINGVGQYPLDKAQEFGFEVEPRPFPYQVFEVERGKTYRIRLLNPSAMGFFNFSIDSHELIPIEVDGVDTAHVDPVDVAYIASGMRYSFLVNMDGQHNKDYWIRYRIDPAELSGIEQKYNHYPRHLIDNPEGLAILRYIRPKSESVSIPRKFTGIPSQGRPETVGIQWNRLVREDPHYCDQFSRMARSEPIRVISNPESLSSWRGGPVDLPNTERKKPSDAKLLNPDDLHPYIGNSHEPDMAPDYFDYQVTLTVGTVGHNRFTFYNGTSFHPTEVPAIFEMLQGGEVSSGYVPFKVDGIGKVVQLVINARFKHPMHLHGHTYWVIANGNPDENRDFDPEIDKDFNLRGVRRETTIPRRWTVIRFKIDNPGVWLLHCHINWHMDAGLAAVIVEAEDEARSFYKPYSEHIKEVCAQAGLNLD